MCSRPSAVMTRPRGVRWMKPELQQERLVDVLDRVRLLAEGHGQRREPDRPTSELVSDRRQELAIRALEADRVDLEQLERLARDVERHGAGMAHLGDIADAPENPVRDTRSATSATGDLLACGVLDLDTENACRAADDGRELSRLVVAEPEGHPEAVPERRRQEARCGWSRRPA